MAPPRRASGCSASRDGDKGGRRGGHFGNKGRALDLVAMEGGAGGRRSCLTLVWRLLISLKAAGCACGQLQGGEGSPQAPLGLGMTGSECCVTPRDRAASCCPSLLVETPLVLCRLLRCPSVFFSPFPVRVVNNANRRGRRSGRPPCPPQRSNSGFKHRGHCPAGLCDSQPVPGCCPWWGDPSCLAGSQP